MNENIIIVTAVLICASSSVLCFHRVEQLEADCFKNEPHLWGKLAFKPMAWFNSTGLINPACSSHFCLFGLNPRHHFLLHITIREERKVMQAWWEPPLWFTSVCVRVGEDAASRILGLMVHAPGTGLTRRSESAAWFCRPLSHCHFSSCPFGWMFPNLQPWFSLQDQVRDQNGFHYGILKFIMA